MWNSVWTQLESWEAKGKERKRTTEHRGERVEGGARAGRDVSSGTNVFVCAREVESCKDKVSLCRARTVESLENNLVYPTFVLFLGRCKTETHLCVLYVCCLRYATKFCQCQTWTLRQYVVVSHHCYSNWDDPSLEELWNVILVFRNQHRILCCGATVWALAEYLIVYFCFGL